MRQTLVSQMSKMVISATFFVLGLGFSAFAAAADLKAIAVLVPEQGTDYGWNQQGVDAARTVAEKYGL